MGRLGASRHIRSRRARRVLLCAFAMVAVAASFALAGCKYSDVLTQHMEDPAAAIDENADPIYQSSPDGERRDDLIDVTLDTSDDTITEAATLPHYDPDAPDNGPTMQRKKSDQTPHDEEASEGEDENDPDRKGEGEGDNGGETGTSADGDKEGEGEGDGDELEGEDSDEATQSEQGGGSGDTVVVDPDGTNDETAKGTVAAVGEYATIAQMLGGGGALAACDQSWLDARADDGCFAGGNDALDKVQVGFSGDGTVAGSCDVNMLTQTAQPSVVLWDSTANVPNLTDADRTALENAGITVQPMPHIGEQNTEDYDVKQAMAAVASVLDGAAGLTYDPLDTLAKYNAVHDEVLAKCYQANNGYSYKVTYASFDSVYQDTPLSGITDSTANRVVTVFVDEMGNLGSQAQVTQHTEVSEGTIALDHDGQTLDCSDGVALSTASSTLSYQLIDYYLQLAGVMNNAYDGPQPEAQGKRYILMPGTTSSFGSSGGYAARVSGSAFFYNGGDATVQSNWHALGDAGFNVVLAATTDIADALEDSAGKSDGLYHMGKEWRVAVVPSGIAGSWSAGHVDSFLLVPWAFRIQKEDNLSAAEGYVSSFYSTFLRCSDWTGAVANWDYVKDGA